jgi:hypothetical protein
MVESIHQAVARVCACGLPAEDDEPWCAQCLTEAEMDALEREGDDWTARCAA